MQTLTAGLVVRNSELAAAVLACLRALGVPVVLEGPVAEQDEAARIQIRRAAPRVLFAELPSEAGRVAELMAMIESLPEPPFVIAVGPTPTPELLIEAMRAGLREFLAPPFEPGVLRKALDRVGAGVVQPPAGRPAGKVISFLSVAGGAGATTLACHVASAMRRIASGEILLTDFDWDAGMVAFWMDQASQYSTLDAAANVHRLDLSLWKGLVSRRPDGIDVLPAPAESPLAGSAAPDRLADVLRFCRFHYEWVIADLGRGAGPAVEALAAESDILLVITTAEIATLFQAKRVLRRLQEGAQAGERCRLVVNRLQKQQQYFRQSEVEKLLAAPVAAVLPDDTTEVQDAHGENRMIAPASDLGKGIEALAATLAGVAPREDKSKSLFSFFR